MSLAADILKMANAKVAAKAEPAKKPVKAMKKPAKAKMGRPETAEKRRHTGGRPDLSYSNSCEPWDAEANATILRLATVDKLSGNQIAARMGRSPTALKTQACRLGISLNNDRGNYHIMTDAERVAVAEMYKLGVKSKEIGRRLNLTENQIRGQIPKLVKCNRHHNWTHHQQWMLVNYHPAMCYAALGEILGIPEKKLRSRKNLLTNNGQKYKLLKMEIEPEFDIVAKKICEKGLDPKTFRTL